MIPAMRCRTLLAALALLLSLAAQGRAYTPSLTSVRPVGGQRGMELEVTFGGDRLSDAKEILFYQPGISVTKLAAVNNNAVKATVKIAADCPLGLHDLRLRTATGISELRTFSVGALKEVTEAEPNSDFAKPQPIAMNSVVNGVADNEDVDYYAVEARKGDRISAEVEGIRVGISQFDPYVAIMDAKRFELASSDDAALVWQDGTASVIAPSDSRYVIQVRESAYAGNGTCLYRLHVGNYPRYTATVPAGGKLGDKVEVTWIGDVAGEKKTTVTLPAKFEKGFGLFAQDEKGISPYPNAFRLSTFGNAIEAEPNDDHAKATAFEPPMAINGVIGKAEDTDHFVFKAKKGQVFDVRVLARSLRSPLDPVLHIVKRNGPYLAGNDDSEGPDSYLRFQAPDDGEYVLVLHDHLKKGGPDYFYRVEVTPVAAKLVLSPPNESIQRGIGPINLAVPRGNRQSVLINATRTDFGGDLNLSLSGLPAGVAFDVDPMFVGIATIPVVLSAKPDAPIAGTLANVEGKHVDPKVQIPCEFSATSEMVLGQNLVVVWPRVVDKLAVVVTEEAPFSIEVVEPKVPLVRGGSMNLKVVARRKPGFDAAIGVALPWNPPGVGSSGGVTIPAKANEALIPMNADGAAPLTTWRIVVDGTSSGPTGPIRVSSQLAKLTVAQQFLTLGFQAASVEQGKETDLVATVNKVADFPGEATVTLIGLPNKVTTDVKKVTKDAKDIIFKIKTDKASPAGNHQNLFCQIIVTMNGEPIVHNLGSGTLRVDVPLPPKPASAAAAPAAVAAPKPAAPAPPPEKRLTRLEKLRLEAAERAKAGGSGK
jgi:hypothetical protein